jgi:hypothetical protein
MDALTVALHVGLRQPHEAVATALAALGGAQPGSMGERVSSGRLPASEQELNVAMTIVLLVEEFSREVADRLMAAVHARCSGNVNPNLILLLQSARGSGQTMREVLAPGLSSFVTAYLSGHTRVTAFTTIDAVSRAERPSTVPTAASGSQMTMPDVFTDEAPPRNVTRPVNTTELPEVSQRRDARANRTARGH